MSSLSLSPLAHHLLHIQTTFSILLLVKIKEGSSQYLLPLRSVALLFSDSILDTMSSLPPSPVPHNCLTPLPLMSNIYTPLPGPFQTSSSSLHAVEAVPHRVWRGRSVVVHAGGGRASWRTYVPTPLSNSISCPPTPAGPPPHAPLHTPPSSTVIECTIPSLCPSPFTLLSFFSFPFTLPSLCPFSLHSRFSKKSLL